MPCLPLHVSPVTTGTSYTLGYSGRVLIVFMHCIVQPLTRRNDVVRLDGREKPVDEFLPGRSMLLTILLLDGQRPFLVCRPDIDQRLYQGGQRYGKEHAPKPP